MFKYLNYLIVFCVLLVFSGCRKSKDTVEFYQLEDSCPPIVRVLLLSEANGCEFASDGQISIYDCNESFLSGQEISDFNKATSDFSVNLTDGKISLDSNSIDSRNLLLVSQNQTIGLNGDEYRGKMVISLAQDNNSFDVMNILSLEDYLKGVVGAEMYSYWEMEALKAQAVASRTYCLYIKKRFATNRNWDMKKSQAHQVYSGIAAETKRVRSAVEQTAGEVLTYKNETKLDIFPTYYASNCGGHTQNSVDVFGGDNIKPLNGVKCPFCKDIAKKRFFNWEPVSFKKSFVQNRLMERYPSLARLGDIQRIETVRKSDYADFTRATFIKLISSSGEGDFLRAEDFRLAIDRSGLKIKSTGFELTDANDSWVFSNGTGYGHGVGLCQCGAEHIARCGKDYKQILSYYYPDSKLVKIFKDD